MYFSAGASAILGLRRSQEILPWDDKDGHTTDFSSVCGWHHFWNSDYQAGGLPNRKSFCTAIGQMQMKVKQVCQNADTAIAVSPDKDSSVHKSYAYLEMCCVSKGMQDIRGASASGIQL